MQGTFHSSACMGNGNNFMNFLLIYVSFIKNKTCSSIVSQKAPQRLVENSLFKNEETINRS